MKHIKTFQDFVNESHLNEINRRLLGRKESKAKLPFFFQIFAREKDSDGTREAHRVSVTGKDDYNEIKRQVEKDYPRSKYYYVIYQNVRGGFRNIGTNESQEITEDVFTQLMEGVGRGNPDIRKVMEIIEEFDADMMEDLLGDIATNYKINADELDNMDAMGIYKHIMEAVKLLKKRTGN